MPLNLEFIKTSWRSSVKKAKTHDIYYSFYYQDNSTKNSPFTKTNDFLLIKNDRFQLLLNCRSLEFPTNLNCRREWLDLHILVEVSSFYDESNCDQNSTHLFEYLRIQNASLVVFFFSFPSRIWLLMWAEFWSKFYSHCDSNS